jgi:hypothetical protein
MSSILKVDTIQDQSGNNIINESGNVITIGASGDTITVPAGATVSGFTSAGIDDNATSTAITISSDEDVTFTEDILLGDNKKAIFGAGSDLQIYHDSTSGHSFLKESGSGSLVVQTNNLVVQNAAGTANIINAPEGTAGLDLYYNGNIKLSTANNGVSVTGIAKVSSASSGVTPNGNADELFVEGSGNSGITIGSGTADAGQLCFGDSGDNDIGAIAYLHDVNAMRFTISGTERARFDTNGNLLLGATSVQGGTANTLQIADGSSARLLLQNTGGGRTYGFFAGTDGKLGLYDYSASAQRLAVDTSGKFGIGTASPTRNLEISDTTSGATTGIRLIGANNGSQVIEFADTDDVNVGYITYDHTNNRMVFRAGDNQQVYVDGSGSLLLGTTSNGSAGNGDLVVNGGIFLGGTGTSNQLDDYEEGTFTPVLEFGNATTGITYNNRDGMYVKVGELVMIQIFIELSNKGSASGNASISGLPFTMRTLSNGWSGVGSGSMTWTNFSTSLYSVSANPNRNTQEIDLAGASSATTSGQALQLRRFC